jgi:hypothetical protein
MLEQGHIGLFPSCTVPGMRSLLAFDSLPNLHELVSKKNKKNTQKHPTKKNKNKGRIEILPMDPV